MVGSASRRGRGLEATTRTLPATWARSTWYVTDPGGLLQEFTDEDEHHEFGDSLLEVLEVAHLGGVGPSSRDPRRRPRADRCSLCDAGVFRHEVSSSDRSDSARLAGPGHCRGDAGSSLSDGRRVGPGGRRDDRRDDPRGDGPRGPPPLPFRRRRPCAPLGGQSRRAVQLVQVRGACQSPSLEASSASIDAKIAWIGIRPLATS